MQQRIVSITRISARAITRTRLAASATSHSFCQPESGGGANSAHDAGHGMNMGEAFVKQAGASFRP
jgi:hypothetical protein